MAKALQTAGMILGTVASVLPGPWQPFAIAASLALTIGGGLLQKKPPVLGSPSEIRIGSNNPTPYLMGRTYSGGTMAHDVGYGATTGGVPNPYRSMVFIDSLGPIGGYEAIKADHTTVAFSGGNAVGYYHDRLYLASQAGACPEGAALSGPFGAIPQWGASHKLSGLAARLLTLRDDKEGKTYSSGIPRFGAVLNGVLVYDPRQDSTYPGGSGAARALDEDTYVGGDAAENPACHGVTYALGRWQGPDGDKKVMGVGLPVESIDWPAWVEFANVCDANGWKIGGRVEEPGSKWDNLKRICEAGGGRPTWVGGKLTVLFPRPRVALDTITLDDIADGEISAEFMRSWKGRKNILVPKIRLETHNWEAVQLEEVRNEALITADGQEEREEYPIELVQQKDQAAELTGYRLLDARETGPLVLNCMPRLRGYKPGDALDLAADVVAEIDPEGVHGLADKPLVIIGRRLDPATMTVEFTLETDTPSKHETVLGTTGTAPETVATPTGEEMDDSAFALKQREITALIANSTITDVDPADGLAQSDDTTITIESHTRLYADKRVAVTGDTAALAAAEGDLNHVYYDDDGREGGAVIYGIALDPADAVTSANNPTRHYVTSIVTPGVGGTSSGGGPTPPGWTPGGWYNDPSL